MSIGLWNGSMRKSYGAATKICNCSFPLSMYYNTSKLRFPPDTSGIVGRNGQHFQHNLITDMSKKRL